MASFIGIDLGTTYSSVSYLDETGRPQIILNSEHDPSFFWIDYLYQ